MTNSTSDDGVLRKISRRKLEGSTRKVWNVLDFYGSLEAIVWLVGGGILAVKGVVHFLSWLF